MLENISFIKLTFSYPARKANLSRNDRMTDTCRLDVRQIWVNLLTAGVHQSARFSQAKMIRRQTQRPASIGCLFWASFERAGTRAKCAKESFYGGLLTRNCAPTPDSRSKCCQTYVSVGRCCVSVKEECKRTEVSGRARCRVRGQRTRRRWRNRGCQFRWRN
jgi:hypothetical protein